MCHPVHIPRFQAILSEGGLYAFQILAREIADDGSFGDSATTDVTIVVTDQGPNSLLKTEFN